MALTAAEKKAQVEALGWNEAKYTKSGVFAGGMKMYGNTPVFFGPKSVFAFDFGFDEDTFTGTEAHDYMTWADFLNATKKKEIDLDNPEFAMGTILIGKYNVQEGEYYEEGDLEKYTGWLNLSDADLEDIERRLACIAATCFEVTIVN